MDQFPLFVAQCAPSHKETPPWLGSPPFQNELSTGFGMTSSVLSEFILVFLNLLRCFSFPTRIPEGQSISFK
jgi:hypothetical protein